MSEMGNFLVNALPTLKIVLVVAGLLICAVISKEVK